VRCLDWLSSLSTLSLSLSLSLCLSLSVSLSLSLSVCLSVCLSVSVSLSVKCRTFPTLNILLYNVFGSSTAGDELYGIEPVSYYVKNLFLNTGLAWLLTLLSPLVVGLDVLVTRRGDIDDRFLVMAASCLLWLALLFSRPHKEERFLYPAFPLICYVAAVTLISAVSLLDKGWSTVFPAKSESVRVPAHVENIQ
jgi:hypothetical protein